MKTDVGKMLPLPSQISVVEKPEGIDLMWKGGGKWVSVVQRLQIIDNTQVVRIDVTGASNNRVTSVKCGINVTAKRMGLKERIRFVKQDENTLICYCNK